MKNSTMDWFLQLLLVLLIIQNIVTKSENNQQLSKEFLPHIISTIEHKDWSSRLSSTNDTIVHPRLLTSSESKEVTKADENQLNDSLLMNQKIETNVKPFNRYTLSEGSQRMSDRRKDDVLPHEEEEEDWVPNDNYEDYKELKSFRYPIEDLDHNVVSEEEYSPPFATFFDMKEPEQKGCRTVVKEVQTIPIESGPQNTDINMRTKRNSDQNSRKYTTIIMTKECHFPEDERTGSDQSSQTAPIAVTNWSATDQPLSSLNFEEYSSSDSSDKMETKPSNDRKSYAKSYPVFRGVTFKYKPQKWDFHKSDSDFKGWSGNQRQGLRGFAKKPNHKKKGMISSQPDGYDFDDQDFGFPEDNNYSENMRSRQKRPTFKNKMNGRKRGTKRKPKRINKSFSFFKRAEPKHKDPNGSDYSVSYGRGNFKSYSNSYDSDRDGPRDGSRGGSRDHRYRDSDDEYD